ncbi:MAG: alkaline phosphatase family protein [Bacteroidetes bacterium]|nr:alkaline phosphatase family protein [Bacteroidota bacterium]
MKPAFLLITLVTISLLASAQIIPQTENIFIITTDGFRWQEVFAGADSTLINNTEFVEDTSIAKQLYWNENMQERRRMLLPFFWNVIAQKGQLYGNRNFGNKSNVANLYKISYPGYNEIFTGYTDPGIIINYPKQNPNTNILEYLNKQEQYHGKVVAFSSWYVFPYILNEERSGLPVNSGYENMQVENDSAYQLINKVQDNVAVKNHTRYDLLTYLNAKEYIEQHHPKIVFIGLGETDEFAHEGHYDKYLQRANAVDKMISDLWYFVQTNSFYKNKTTFIITTDHGRGKKTFNWSNHSLFTNGSAQTWLAMIGPGIEPLGEIKEEQQIYQKQIAGTIALLLGQKFETEHKVGKPIPLPQSPALHLVSK